MWAFGLVEEAAELGALAFLTHRLAHKYAGDGLILGAATRGGARSPAEC